MAKKFGFRESNVYGNRYLNTKKNEHYIVKKWMIKDGCPSFGMNEEEFDTVLSNPNITEIVYYFPDLDKSFIVDKEKARQKARYATLGKYEPQVFVAEKWCRVQRGRAV